MVGTKATPYCVAGHIIFVCGDRGDGIFMGLCLCYSIWMRWIYIDKGVNGHKAEPISATVKGEENIFGGIINYVIILWWYILCVGCVDTRLG